MAERVPSDHPSVSTVRAKIVRSGGTTRPCLRLPSELSLSGGDVVRLSLGGETYHAPVVEDAEGLLVRGAYDNKRLARNPGESENRLVEWCGTTGRDPGSSVEVDEVEPEFFYGVRVPGKRVVYDVPQKPNDSLASIAEKLEDN
ncbi:hypothetical protein SAMN04487948_108142 [Halogranum amylolyticum]|uniref:Uncharacterized protein n=1 Tax=Halogranum amylolyticum TaxID=660520 RepID=A0A1H8TV02_9EURY|nr:hypothetical protein [Halogranum amylolyticum]SEO94737.1 hypothetical protein SAMN04487948_108142 [Halogranum amylolyticum]